MSSIFAPVFRPVFGPVFGEITDAPAWRGGSDPVPVQPLDQLIVLAGSAGFVHIPGVSSCWQDAARTVPAGDGDPVRVIDDLTGNDYHWIAPNDPARPILVAADGYWHLDFDGVDDHMVMGGLFNVPSWPHDGSGATLAMAVQDLSAPGNQYGLFATSRVIDHTGLALISISLGTGLVAYINASGGAQPVISSMAGLADIRLVRMEHATADDPQWQLQRNHALVGSGSYGGTPSDADASYIPHLMRSVQLNNCMAGKWYGGCLLPVTGHGALVDSVLQAYMPPIPEEEPAP